MAETFFDRVYKNKAAHVPDVLSCLANLSNDEVFTPPEVVNQMLDMLPQELFSDPNTKFLDPACKTGVFLREIAKRLLEGLKDQIPDLQERIDHIFHEQLYGIGITELTSLLSRRSLYCSKYPNGQYSITHFDDAEGNIRFKRIEHSWDKNGKCVLCGASKGQWGRGDDLETYAYEFIHVKPERIFNMKFDVIISNPPYQLKTTEIEGKANAVPIYNKFVEQARKMNSRFLTMIIPARWYAGGAGLDDFRSLMLHDDSIVEIDDFVNEKDCFPGVDIKGGVCYFLRDNNYHGECIIKQHDGENVISSAKRPLLEEGMDTFIRHNNAISILNRVRMAESNAESFSSLVSPQTPFGIISSFKDYHKNYQDGDIKYYTSKDEGWVNPSYIKARRELVAPWKVYISAAYGAGEGYPHQIINRPFVGEPQSCCSQTYLVIGGFESKQICENVISYIKTKFFRFMVMLKKNAQHAMRGVYECVPMQDFSKPWTDEELYAKYGLTQEEIDFIESMIRPMDSTGGEE